MSKKDLYRILEIPRTATLKEIKASYRKLAMKYHPDLCEKMNKAEAESIFKEITLAYQTLNNISSKREYDYSIGNDNVNWNLGTRTKAHGSYRARIRTVPGGVITPEMINLKVWNAWHYGDNAVAEPAVKHHNRGWKNPNCRHEQYFRRRYRSDGTVRSNIFTENELTATVDEIKGNKSKYRSSSSGGQAANSSKQSIHFHSNSKEKQEEHFDTVRSNLTKRRNQRRGGQQLSQSFSNSSISNECCMS